MKTRVKIVVSVENRDTPCWPCINHDYNKEVNRALKPIIELNKEMDFDVVTYTDVQQAKDDYEADLKKYDGILLLLMTCWKKIDEFYCRQAEEGIPVVVADIPFCGSGSILCVASPMIKKEKLPVPLISSLNYTDIADAVKLFDVIRKMKDTKILVVSNGVNRNGQDSFTKKWGCQFINCTAADLHAYFQNVAEDEAKKIAEKWIDEAAGVIEPNEEEIIVSAKLYLAIKKLKEKVGADAVTVDCLTLSYGNQYTNKAHMYPCLSHFEMTKNGEVAVCEADINATVTSLITLYLTGRPGYVSDPVIDTSSDQIIYAHCVACTKVYGVDDPRCCKYYIRSHAEDKLGASVQVIFPAGEKLTTTMVYSENNLASVHSSVSVGNVGGDEACRSKLAATTNAEKLLYNWAPGWHRVTVFGDYRKQFMNLFRMKGLDIYEEDK